MHIPPKLIKRLQTARAVAVLTGAGVSAESGVPTFRDAQSGLWANYKPEDLATPAAFERDPKLVWEWYAWRRELVAQVQPNPGHMALAEMEKRLTARGAQFVLLTQNVDNLHQIAGSHNVVELHGNLRRVKCFQEDEVVETWPATTDVPPRCPRCHGYLRPDVVWFGENLPAHALETAWAAAQQAEVFFSIGTSAMVHPAAALPLQARDSGAYVVEINPTETPLTAYAHCHLAAPSGEALPALNRAVWGA